MSGPDELLASANTDREIWRERPGDYYADSIHVTEGGGIGIDCGGNVHVKPIRQWHALAEANAALAAELEEMKRERAARNKIDPVTRMHNLCDGLAEHRNESPYNAEALDLADQSYRELLAKNAALAARCGELAKWAERALPYLASHAAITRPTGLEDDFGDRIVHDEIERIVRTLASQAEGETG